MMHFSDYHTHTTFSDGKNTPQEMAAQAVQKGLTALGFSDHSYTPCSTGYCMMPERYPAYFYTIRELRERYAGRLDILTGLELDYYSPVLRDHYDYLIASVHYLCAGGECHPIDHSLAQQEHCLRTLCGGDRLELARRYYDLVVANVTRARPDIIGHFDVITKFGLFDEDMPSYEAYCHIAEEALDAALAICPVVEMNTGGIARGMRRTPYPALPLLRHIREKGGEIVLTSDAHTAQNIAFYFEECVDILRQVGFDHVVYWTSHGKQSLPLSPAPM